MGEEKKEFVARQSPRWGASQGGLRVGLTFSTSSDRSSKDAIGAGPSFLWCVLGNPDAIFEYSDHVDAGRTWKIGWAILSIRAVKYYVGEMSIMLLRLEKSTYCSSTMSRKNHLSASYYAHFVRCNIRVSSNNKANCILYCAKYRFSIFCSI